MFQKALVKKMQIQTSNRLFAIIVTITLIIPSISGAQITNRILRSEHKSTNREVLVNKVTDLTVYKTPNLNLKSILVRDSLDRLEGKPFRFGEDFDVDINFI